MVEAGGVEPMSETLSPVESAALTPPTTTKVVSRGGVLRPSCGQVFLPEQRTAQRARRMRVSRSCSRSRFPALLLLIRGGRLGENADDLVGFALLVPSVNRDRPFEFRLVAVKLSVNCVGNWLAAASMRSSGAPICSVSLGVAIDHNKLTIWQEQTERCAAHNVAS
jgi:hypothetical protein